LNATIILHISINQHIHYHCEKGRKYRLMEGFSYDLNSSNASLSPSLNLKHKLGILINVLSHKMTFGNAA